MSHQMTIEYTDDILFTLGLSALEFSDKAKLLLAAKLYELGKLSSGQAARLAGKERVDFLLTLSRFRIALSNLRSEDMKDELAFALNE